MEHIEEISVRQKRVLAQIAAGQPLSIILDEIVTTIERQIPGSLCSILLVCGDHLRVSAANSLPDAYNCAIDGIAIGPNAGSCGTAVARREPVIVSNIATDPLWADFRDFALPHGLASCWSFPIFSIQRGTTETPPQVLGTFALYSCTPVSPSPDAIQAVSWAAYLASIAIVNEQTFQALKESEERSRELARIAQHKEQRFRSIFENAGVGILFANTEHVIDANRAFLEMIGYTAEELKTQAIADLIHPDDYLRERYFIDKLRSGENTEYNTEVRYIRKDRTIGWMRIVARSFIDVKGVPVAVATIQEITQRKEAEEALRSSEKELRHLFANMKDFIFVIDREGRYRKAAPTNTNAQTKINTTLHEHFPKEIADYFLHTIHNVLSTQGSARLDYSLVLGGKEFWFSTNVCFLDSESVLWAARDITEQKSVEEALRRSEARFQQLATASPGVIFTSVYTPSAGFRYEYLNPAFEEIHEVSVQEALKDTALVSRQFHPQDSLGYWEGIWHSLETMQPFHHEWRIQTPSGKVKWLQASAQPERRENGDTAWHGVVQDITDRKQAEHRFQNLAANMPGVIFQFAQRPDGSHSVLYVSPGCRDLWEMEPAEIEQSGDALFALIHSEDRIATQTSLSASAHTLEPWNAEWRIVTPSGRPKWLRGSSRPQRQANGDIVWDGLILDVSEHKRDQELLAYNALHDPLTGLPNRTLLVERLDLAINRARRIDSYGYAVLFLDLNRFKVINDSLGHLAGDQILKGIARRLQRHLRGVDLVARLGGDEFVILLEDIPNPERAIQITERILNDFLAPLSLNDGEMVVDTSIGIVFGNREYRRAADLLRDADIAMYRAKAMGGNSYKLFDVDMHTQAVNRLTLETYLRKALEREEFVVYYQPIIDLFRDRLIGFEVLARLIHPTHGFVAPGDFVPVAEETGLIVPLDHWVLFTASQQLATWKQKYANAAPLTISINLSVQDLRKASLIQDIDRTLLATGLPGSALALEITESMLIENISKTIDLLSELKERNIQISIDDFGTGYSSLSYLHRLPADNLKIDRSFVSQMQQGNPNYQVVSTIIALSNQLGLAAVAEGIETPQQLRWLRQLGCEYGQGYLFATPLSAEEIEARYFLGGITSHLHSSITATSYMKIP